MVDLKRAGRGVKGIMTRLSTSLNLLYPKRWYHIFSILPYALEIPMGVLTSFHASPSAPPVDPGGLLHVLG